METTIQQQANGLWSVMLPTGAVILSDESYQVASEAAAAINRPDEWEPTEAYEIAALQRFDYDRMIASGGF